MTKAYVLPHPPLAVPAVGRGEEAKIKDTLSAFRKAAQEIAEFAPQTLIVVTPHSTVYSDYFHISPGEKARGDLSRFGVSTVVVEASYDTALAQEIKICVESLGIPAGGKGERDPSLDHGTLVPLWFINQEFTGYNLVRISPTGMRPVDHYIFGQAISSAVEKTGRRVVLIASGDLSHKLTKEGPYGFAPEGPQFDQAIVSALSTGDLPALAKIPADLREGAAECGYNSLMVMAGYFDGKDVETRLLSYEGPFGVGYAVASVCSLPFKLY